MAVTSAVPSVATLLRVLRRRWDEQTKEIVAEQQVAAEKKRVRGAAIQAMAAFKLPSYEVSREAARLLHEKVEGAADRPVRHILLPAAIHAGDVHRGEDTTTAGATARVW